MHARDWALAFLLTLVVETPVYLLATRRSLGVVAALVMVLVVNIATHPIAWTIIMLSCGSSPYGFLAVEGVVVFVEGLLLFSAGRSRFARQPVLLRTSFAISLAANCFSAGLGLLLL